MTSLSRRIARRRKRSLIALVIGVVWTLACVGLFVYGVRSPYIAEKSATALVTDAGGSCSRTDCLYTVVFTDARGALVKTNLSAPTYMNLHVASTTMIYYEVANPSYTRVGTESFGNDNGSHLIGLGLVYGAFGVALTVIAVIDLAGARRAARRQAMSPAV
jgi:hypothetical protein